MNIGFYAGSFDPFTVGHLEVVKKAAKIFDKVIVAIGVNPAKNRNYDAEKMKIKINKLLKSLKLNAECITFEGLTADEAKKYDAKYLIRGLRGSGDFIAEETLAEINYEISGLDTIYFRAGKYGMVSSSMVRELIKYKKDISKYLPTYVIDLVK